MAYFLSVCFGWTWSECHTHKKYTTIFPILFLNPTTQPRAECRTILSGQHTHTRTHKTFNKSINVLISAECRKVVWPKTQPFWFAPPNPKNVLVAWHDVHTHARLQHASPQHHRASHTSQHTHRMRWQTQHGDVGKSGGRLRHETLPLFLWVRTGLPHMMMICMLLKVLPAVFENPSTVRVYPHPYDYVKLREWSQTQTHTHVTFYSDRTRTRTRRRKKKPRIVHDDVFSPWIVCVACCVMRSLCHFGARISIVWLGT